MRKLLGKEKAKIDTNYIEKLYNDIAGKQFKGNYEKNRWANKSEKSRYEMISNTLIKISKDYKFKEYIEIGPGPGTWTKIFLERNKNAKFTLVDISYEMLEQAKKNLINYSNLVYLKGDFLKIPLGKKFDFFFSSRALEYLSDKEFAFKRIGEIIKKNGNGVIITKTPHPIKDKIYNKIGRKIRHEHKDQISLKRMKNLLEKNGFVDIKFFNVITEFPPSVRYNQPVINKKLYSLFNNKKPGIFLKPFSEAYMVIFRKK